MHIDQAGHDSGVGGPTTLVRTGPNTKLPHTVPTASNSIATDRCETFRRQVPVPVEATLRRQDRQTIEHHNHYTGSMPEIAVTITPKTTMKMKNFKWSSTIMQTRNPSHGKTGDRHARHGAGVMVWLAN